MKKKQFKITSNQNWCKGCEICVKICPKNVFEMQKDPGPKGYFIALVEHPELCIGCLECELHCPDLAIEVKI
ncbi:MAG: 4Fe-4S binding protein [Planctomycetota bacterium]